MRYAIFIMALFLLPSFANADAKLSAMPSGIYELDPTHASITWKVDHLGLSKYTARFTKFTSKIKYNNIDPMKSQVIAEIDPTSIETDYPATEKKDFNKKLIEDTGWFNSKKFPTIKFKSTKLEKISDKTANLTGDLTFLGVTKPVTLKLIFNKALGNHPFKNKPAFGFSAVGNLKRSDFGMDTYIPKIGDDVEILIEAEYIYAK
jgi:polyisoprenoid-binding protein YceI